MIFKEFAIALKLYFRTWR